MSTLIDNSPPSLPMAGCCANAKLIHDATGFQVSDVSKSSPRILFLNRSYWPDVEATGQLLTQLCESLAATFTVTVVVGQPNSNPDGEIYRSLGRETHGGVDIQRVFHSRFSKRSLWGRGINLASYLLSATIRSLFLPRPAVIVAETDPPLLCLLGLLLRRRYGCRLVLYLQDIYPDIALAVGKLREGPFARSIRWLLYSAYRKADLVVVLSQDMRQGIMNAGVAPERIACVANWADTNRLVSIKRNNAFRRRHQLDDKFVVMYSGNLGLTQRLENVLAAAQMLQGQKELLFVFVGDGAMRHQLLAQAKRMRLTNVRFLDYQRQDQLSQSISAADVHLIPLDPRLMRCLMPSKLYGILATGTPVIAMAPPASELSHIVQRYHVGLVCPPSDPERLVESVRWCLVNQKQLDMMGVAARQLAVQRYDRRHATAAFERLLHGVQHVDNCCQEHLP